MEEWDQSNLCFFHASEIFIPCLTISFGQMTAGFSLNVATNGECSSPMNISNVIILKQKRRSATKVTWVFPMILSSIPWVTTYFLEVSARVLLKVAINSYFRGLGISKISIFEAIILKQNEGMKFLFLCWFWNIHI